MKRAALPSAALALLLLSSCSKVQTPPAQAAYIQQWSALRSEWKQSDGNDIVRGEVEQRARAFFNVERRVDRWEAEVVSVKSSLGSSWLEAKSGGMTFLLWPPDGQGAALVPLLKQARPGDRVVFDGSTSVEFSITISGAILDPEVRVTLSNVELFPAG